MKYFLSIVSVLFSSLFIVIGAMIIMRSNMELWEIGLAVIAISYGIISVFSLYIAIFKAHKSKFKTLKYCSVTFLSIFILANFDSGLVSGQEFSIIIMFGMTLFLNWLFVNKIAKNA